MSTPPLIPRSAEELYRNIKARRSGLLKALTIDVEKLYDQCDPAKENLCLFGLPDQTWNVSTPPNEVPPEIPDPILGINFAREELQRGQWLSLVAIYCDIWLLSLAFYFGSRIGFDKAARERLFNEINALPTLCDIVKGTWQNQEAGQSSKKRKSEDEDDGNSLCGACGIKYVTDEFWICCDTCDRWFHGDCVSMTPSKAEHFPEYKCPACILKDHHAPPLI